MSTATNEDGYRSVDLSAAWNADVGIFEDPQDVQLGERMLYGIPFRFGTPAAAVLHLQRGESATMPIARRARWIVFAHAVHEADLYEGGSIGEPVGDYTLRYADGRSHRIGLRQRFEIGPTPRRWNGRPLPLDWGQTPFLAFNDAEHELMDRACGRYDEAGARFVDIRDPQSRVPYVLPYRFYLWAMPNPLPDIELAAIEATATGSSLLIGAITTSELDEPPFTRDVARNVLLELLEGEMDERISVSIDRGSATYVYRTTPGYEAENSPSAASPVRLPDAWGRPIPDSWASGYARISGNPSATVQIDGPDGPIGAFGWGDLLERGELTAGAVRVRLPEAGQAWVRLRIVDADGRPLPCRIRMQTVDGIPLAPHGHHAHINSDGGTWNLDIGGDVRLGSDTFAFVDGRCEGWLPLGEVDVEVARGFEYRPIRRRLTVSADRPELVIELPRLFDARARGYVSGDTHVHFLSTQGAELEARAEDVGVANLLLTQWGHLFTSTEEFTGRPQVSEDGTAVVFAGQENRTNMLGHINLLGLREPITPWCTGGSEEADLGGGLETTLSHWADECRAQGGTVVLAHFPVPYGETAALLATGRLDAVETIAYDDYNIREYYRYLNAGYRVPLVAGTDKMTSEVSVGMMRTYAGVDRTDRTDYWDWCAGIKRGDTLASSGPLLWLSVDGHRPGETIAGVTERVDVLVELETVFPVDEIELVVDGRVVHREAVARGAARHAFRFPLTVRASSWVAARCRGAGDLRHTDTWSRPVFAHTAPLYLCAGDTWEMFDEALVRVMLGIVDGARRYVDERARTVWPAAAHHRHGDDDHMTYLTRPFDEATAALTGRLRSHGIEP
jgi:hypothetical protein